MSFRINRVYTRTGDDGSTVLIGGSRISKADLRIECSGTIDELSSVLGLAKESLDSETIQLQQLIEYLQQELFDVGSEVATPFDEVPEATREMIWRTTADQVLNLEKLCDAYGDGLPELQSFILPGGSKAAAFFHLARTVARRAERNIVALNDRLKEGGKEELNPELVRYVNRLSDLLFNVARWTLVKQEKEAPLWKQFADRKLPLPE